MGLTIHYTLQSDAADAAAAGQLVARLHEAARGLPFEKVGEIGEFSGTDCDPDSCKDAEFRWLLAEANRYVTQEKTFLPVPPTHVIVFSAQPGPGCEPANFGLCQYPASIRMDGQTIPTGFVDWSWQSYCKTQYASNPNCGGIENFQRCHLAVIGMLDHCAAAGILEQVVDEGDYWKKRNVEDLARQVTQWNTIVASVVGQVKDALGEAIAAAITQFPNFEHLEAKGRKPKEK